MGEILSDMPSQTALGGVSIPMQDYEENISLSGKKTNPVKRSGKIHPSMWHIDYKFGEFPSYGSEEKEREGKIHASINYFLGNLIENAQEKNGENLRKTTAKRFGVGKMQVILYLYGDRRIGGIFGNEIMIDEETIRKMYRPFYAIGKEKLERLEEFNSFKRIDVEPEMELNLESTNKRIRRGYINEKAGGTTTVTPFKTLDGIFD